MLLWWAHVSRLHNMCEKQKEANRACFLLCINFATSFGQPLQLSWTLDLWLQCINPSLLAIACWRPVEETVCSVKRKPAHRPCTASTVLWWSFCITEGFQEETMWAEGVFFNLPFHIWVAASTLTCHFTVSAAVGSRPHFSDGKLHSLLNWP